MEGTAPRAVSTLPSRENDARPRSAAPPRRAARGRWKRAALAQRSLTGGAAPPPRGDECAKAERGARRSCSFPVLDAHLHEAYRNHSRASSVRLWERLCYESMKITAGARHGQGEAVPGARLRGAPDSGHLYPRPGTKRGRATRPHTRHQPGFPFSAWALFRGDEARAEAHPALVYALPPLRAAHAHASLARGAMQGEAAGMRVSQPPTPTLASLARPPRRLMAGLGQLSPRSPLGSCSTTCGLGVGRADGLIGGAAWPLRARAAATAPLAAPDRARPSEKASGLSTLTALRYVLPPSARAVPW